MALEKLPVHKGLVWRGIEVANLTTFLREYAISEDGAGSEVVWKAFSSATFDENQALAGNVLFIIQSENGRRLGDYADLREEQEVLFAPGSCFRVQGLEHTAVKAIVNLIEVSPSKPIGEHP
jgi:hypothetical protein